jgi:hypothetical protein
MKHSYCGYVCIVRHDDGYDRQKLEFFLGYQLGNPCRDCPIMSRHSQQGSLVYEEDEKGM